MKCLRSSRRAAAAAVLLLAIAAGQLHSGTEAPEPMNPPGGGKRTAPTTFEFTAYGYFEGPTVAHEFCLVAIGYTGSQIVSVDNVTLINEANGLPFPGMGPFAQNATVANEIEIRQFSNGINAQTWVGFLGEALSGMPTRERARFVFELTVLPSATDQDILDAFDVGSDAVLAGGGIGTDRANSDGTPTLSQLAIKPFAVVWGGLPAPATSDIGLLLLAIGLGLPAALLLMPRRHA